MPEPTQPKSTLVDVITYLKTDEGEIGMPGFIRGTPTPTSMMKEITLEDRLELRASLDVVLGL